MMLQINPIEMAVGFTADISDEIADLEKLTEEATIDESKLDKAMNTFRHLMSFIAGASYILHYAEDSDEKADIMKHAIKWHEDEIASFWARLMTLDSRRKLGRNVKIQTCYRADGKLAVTVWVDDEERIFSSREDARDYLRSLKK